jgi:hypothetical protein
VGIEKDLANDIMLAMITLELENVLLKAFLAKQDVSHLEKTIANAKTDLAMIRDVLQAIAPLHAELHDADTLDQLAKRYVEMHIRLRLSPDQTN